MSKRIKGAQRDHAILMADALLDRVKNASLGQFVEWLTAYAVSYRSAAVDGSQPEPAIEKIARELIDGLDKALPATLNGDDAEERRRLHERVEVFVGAMKPALIADFLDEMAEGFREILLYNSAERFLRLHRSMQGDIALINSPTVRDLVRLDRVSQLVYYKVEEDHQAMHDPDCVTTS